MLVYVINLIFSVWFEKIKNTYLLIKIHRLNEVVDFSLREKEKKHILV